MKAALPLLLLSCRECEWALSPVVRALFGVFGPLAFLSVLLFESALALFAQLAAFRPAALVLKSLPPGLARAAFDALHLGLDAAFDRVHGRRLARLRLRHELVLGL